MLQTFALILTAALIRIILTDELISAQCQAKCLHELELRYQDDTEQRRRLKHHIMQICKEEAECSSCTEPCRKDFTGANSCKEASCKQSAENAACESSCDFLQKIFEEKPGACPIMTNQSTYECTALCHLDGDCTETRKCCSYGCSRQCVLPRKQDHRLLPIPTSITVQERKRKRSIIIRWEVQKLTREQQEANSNLYVVQWRWGLQQHGEVMTDWQTVTVRNKPYAILKHLLSPGRYYQFRIGAVNIYGCLGFSKPSTSFKMSKAERSSIARLPNIHQSQSPSPFEARAPSPPRNISLGASKLTPIGLWNQVVQWTPPLSDLPIKNYQLSWSVSSASDAEAFEEMMRRRATLNTYEKRSLDEQEEVWVVDGRDRHSVIIPSHTTQSELSGLFPNSVYIVEIHASVDSSEGELHGEKGLIFIRTPNSTASGTDERRSLDETGLDTEDANSDENENDDNDNASIDIQALHLNGQLQTIVNWIRSPLCTAGKNAFVVRTTRGACRVYRPEHLSDKGVTEVRTTECSAKVRDLFYDCDYTIEVIQQDDAKTVAICRFSTASKEAPPSRGGAECLPVSTPLYCIVHSAVTCRWATDSGQNSTAVIGYRVALSSPMLHDTNISILAPLVKEIHYEELVPSTLYTLQMQPITNRGLGKALMTNFVTVAARLDENAIARYPGGIIIELPLESLTYSIFVYHLIIILLALHALL